MTPQGEDDEQHGMIIGTVVSRVLRGSSVAPAATRLSCLPIERADRGEYRRPIHAYLHARADTVGLFGQHTSSHTRAWRVYLQQKYHFGEPYLYTKACIECT